MMADSNPVDRVIATLSGTIPDRVPTFCAGIEDRTFYEVLGQPKIHNSRLLRNPLVQWLLNRLGPRATGLLQRTITKGMRQRIQAQVELGFDCIWALYDRTFIGRDAKTMIKYSGSLFDLIDDGYGNMSYFYREPCIHSRVEYEQWPYWPDPDKLASQTYKFYAPFVQKYGQKTCFMAQGPHYGIFEQLMWALGPGKMMHWIRKEKDLVQDFITRCENIMSKCINAMMDAGIRVILQTDDMGFKSGPLLAPALIDDLFGPPYTRLVKQVHDRKGFWVQHTCGDNTDLFELYVKWGIDGVHALENTSHVDPVQVKQRWGNKLTLIGGVGIDYLLSGASTDGEVEEGVKHFLQLMAPGGRFIIGPVHSETSIPAAKLRLLIEVARKHGAYPLRTW